jgi:hypothetical protein
MRQLALGVVTLLCLGGCEKKPAAAPAPVTQKLGQPPARAEVEFSGDWKSNGLAAARTEFVAQAEPCLPVPEKPTTLGTQKLEKEGPVFAEFFILQGTKGHACLYSWDEHGKVVAAASYAKNPLTFEGSGEIEIGPMVLSLSKVE